MLMFKVVKDIDNEVVHYKQITRLFTRAGLISTF